MMRAIDLRERLWSGQVVLLAVVAVVEQGLRGDGGDVVQVDRGEGGAAICRADNALIADHVRPIEHIVHVLAGAEEGPLEDPGILNSPFDGIVVPAARVAGGFSIRS
jgi:hypothetical protein